jgi:uncharacterized delta-60 repeat protein
MVAVACALAWAPSVNADVVSLRPDGSVLALATLQDGGDVQTVLVALGPGGAIDPGFADAGILRRLDPSARMAVMHDGAVRLLTERVDCDLDFTACDVNALLRRFGSHGDPDGETVLDDGIEHWPETVDVAPAGDGLLALLWSWDGPTVFRLDALGNPLTQAVVPLGLSESPLQVLAAANGDAVVVTSLGLVRMDAAGPVSGFGDDGRVAMGALHVRAAALAADAVAVTGTLEAPSTTNVARVREDGTLDPAFAGDGRAEIDAGDGRRIDPADVKGSPGGTIVVAGTTTGGASDFAIARLGAGGALDDSYGDDGRALVDFAGRDDRLRAIAVGDDGSVVAIGTSRPAGAAEPTELAVARLLPDGSPDPDFGADGRARIAVDVKPPGVTVEQAPAERAIVPPTVTVAGGSPEPDAVVACTLDDAAPLPCAEPVTFGPLGVGQHRLVVSATDAVGNRSTAVRRFDVTPHTAITAAPPALAGASSAKLSFAEVGLPGAPIPQPYYPLHRYECRLDGAPAWDACSSPWTIADLPDGPHSAEVRRVLEYWWCCHEESDNPILDHRVVEPVPARAQWRTDTRPPATAVLSAPGRRTQDTTATVAFAADEEVAGSECRLDAGEWTACTSPVSYSGLALGGHELWIRSTDLAGHREEPGAHLAWDVVAPAPVVEPPPAVEPPGVALARRRAAAHDGLTVRAAAKRLSPRRGLPVLVGSAVDALVHVDGTVRVRGARRRARVTPIDARVTAATPASLRIRLPRAARALVRRAGRHRLVFRLAVTLADPDAELTTRVYRLEVPPR